MNIKYLILSIIVFVSITIFGQKKIPGAMHVDNYSDEWAKSYFDQFELDPIEGFWQSNDGMKYAVKKYMNSSSNSEIKSTDISYRMYVSSPNVDNGIWIIGDVKAIIQNTSNINLFSMEFTTCVFPEYFVENIFCIVLNPAMIKIKENNGNETILVKLYPKTGNELPKTQSSNYVKSSGTGFGLSSDGYIITNYHVIKDANSIEVKGINGIFSKKLTAEVIVSDEKNDLAIIKINDPSFISLGFIPYSIRQGVADVGENVFVLGFPLTSSMGEEVKLTNGIVSSKTGYQGDISTYQISAPVQPGNSGGPLFDKNGYLIGVVNAKHTIAENAGYAIKINYVNNLIELLPQSISFPQINILNGKILTEQVKIASNFTYLIIINDKENLKKENKNIDAATISALNKILAYKHYQNSYELYKNKEYKEALKEINLSIESSTGSEYPGSFHLRASIYMYGFRNYEEAISDFTKSLQIDSDVIASYFDRGRSYYYLDKHIEAINDFTKIISLDKETTEAYYMRALVKSDINDCKGAISDYDEIIKRKKTSKSDFYEMAIVYNNKAYCLIELNLLQEALPLVNEALELNNKSSYIWDTSGELYFKRGEFERCIKDMTKAIELDKNSNNSFYYRGLAKIKLGKNKEGCEDLFKAKEFGKVEADTAIKEKCR